MHKNLYLLHLRTAWWFATVAWWTRRPILIHLSGWNSWKSSLWEKNWCVKTDIIMSSIWWVSVNTKNMTNPSNVSPVKMEYGWNFSISGLKMMVKSCLEKIFLKFLHPGDYFPLLHKSAQNHKFSNKNNYLPAWRDFKNIFSRQLFTIIFKPKMLFLFTHSILST